MIDKSIEKYIKKYSVNNTHTKEFVNIEILVYDNEKLIYLSHDLLIKANKLKIFVKRYDFQTKKYSPWLRIKLDGHIKNNLVLKSNRN